MAWLTKSRFMAGRQCTKRLWFEVNQPLETHAPESMAMLQGRAFDAAGNVGLSAIVTVSK